MTEEQLETAKTNRQQYNALEKLQQELRTPTDALSELRYGYHKEYLSEVLEMAINREKSRLDRDFEEM